jgi:hypothetical protein
MLSLKRLPIGLELFMAAIRSVRLINRLSKSPKVIGLELFMAAIRSVRLINRLSKSAKVIQSLKNIFDDEPLVTLDTGINFL